MVANDIVKTNEEVIEIDLNTYYRAFCERIAKGTSLPIYQDWVIQDRLAIQILTSIDRYDDVLAMATEDPMWTIGEEAWPSYIDKFAHYRPLEVIGNLNVISNLYRYLVKDRTKYTRFLAHMDTGDLSVRLVDVYATETNESLQVIIDYRLGEAAVNLPVNGPLH